MPIIRSMLASIETIIQQSQGIAAGLDGQLYQVKRLTPSTNGSISSNAPVMSSFHARVYRMTKKAALENATFDLLVYKAICNTTMLKSQDLLFEVGEYSAGQYTDGSIFTFAQHRVTRETIFVRTEANCTYTRPMPVAGGASQQPTSGSVEVVGWGGITKSDEQILTLTNGAYSFEDAAEAVPATVYCGLQPTSRVSDTAKSKEGAGAIPTALYRERFMIYVPELPGIMPAELDRINFPNTDRYEIMEYHSTDAVGLTGYVCICEKLST